MLISQMCVCCFIFYMPFFIIWLCFSDFIDCSVCFLVDVRIDKTVFNPGPPEEENLPQQ